MQQKDSKPRLRDVIALAVLICLTGCITVTRKIEPTHNSHAQRDSFLDTCARYCDDGGGDRLLMSAKLAGQY